jgi:hypothetical protein
MVRVSGQWEGGVAVGLWEDAARPTLQALTLVLGVITRYRAVA